VASPLSLIYPHGVHGPEYSFEEISAAKRGLRDVRTGHSESIKEELDWQREIRERGTRWRCDELGSTLKLSPPLCLSMITS